MRNRASQSRSQEPPTDGVVAWRTRRLERAGFDRALAGRLASDRRFDLHAVLELTDRGCPPQLAARILAPLDEKPKGTS